jgi:zinc protease
LQPQQRVIAGSQHVSRSPFVGFALLAFFSSVGALHAKVVPYSERVHEHILPNGLKLILLEDHKAPVAVFQIWYRVGSRNEALGTTGLSHLLEHMMFKGTERVPPEQYSRIIQRNGGQTNAFTSQDHTTYFATMASDRINVVAELEADRMVNLKINAELYDPERDVVKEERRLRVENNPASALFEQLQAAAYTAHPYQFPVIGWMADIAQSRLADLLRHYRTYYSPNNAFVVAVGDFSTETFVAELERLFGSIPSGPMPPTVRSIEPLQRGERRIVVRRPAELPFVAAAFHVPNLRSDDGAALEVLAEILSGGESSRLHRRLVYQRRVARSAAADYDYASADPGLLTVYAQPLPGKSVEQVERALFEELERIKETPPTAQEITKAKSRIEAAFVFAQDSLFYQGMLLGQYEIAGNWRWIDDYLPKVRAVTTEDLMRVARFYLRQDNRTVATLVPLPADGAPAATDQPLSGSID